MTIGVLWLYAVIGVYVAFQVALVVKNLLANAEDIKDTGSISGSERSPGGGNGNPLQYSCLENQIGVFDFPHRESPYFTFRVSLVLYRYVFLWL